MKESEDIDVIKNLIKISSNEKIVQKLKKKITKKISLSTTSLIIQENYQRKFPTHIKMTVKLYYKELIDNILSN